MNKTTTKFKVNLTRRIDMKASIEIEADSAKEAEEIFEQRLASGAYKDLDKNSIWKNSEQDVVLCDSVEEVK